MAYPWACDFNPHLQMESRIKGGALSIIVAAAMIASTSTAFAATSKPTSKPTSKVTVKAKPKATPRPKVTKKSVLKKKPAVRKPSPKKVVYKRKVVKVSPSPSPKWPPTGFKNPPNSDIYYRIPNGTELLGELSAAATLSNQFKPCAKLACGVVKVASSQSCTWWSVDSVVYGPLSPTDATPVPYGNLHTTAKATKARQVITIIMMSTEQLKKNMYVGKLGINCYHSPVTEKVPANIYTANTPTPGPSDTPTTNTN